MSNAWETTSDDIWIVLKNSGIDKTDDEINDICDFQIDHDEVEKVALCGNDIDEQVNYAHDEIKKQLKEFGHI